MNLTIEQITQEALTLPDDERAQLADTLMESLNGTKLSEAWSNEIARRLEGVRSGRVKAIPEAKARAQLRLAANGQR